SRSLQDCHRPLQEFESFSVPIKLTRLPHPSRAFRLSARTIPPDKGQTTKRLIQLYTRRLF
uniref:Uncharacterized protein n=1 Tax=Parascaris univalens TaxID=6257 RepID=A0A914ZV77_PARUN